jgi:sterol desaturase/sphingolipid hydroxylase (fatty acid hydroxylase superfamily)
VPDIDTIGWYALGIPLYTLYVTLEIVLARRRRERVFSLAETISNLTAGLGTLIIGLFIGPWVLLAWDFVAAHIAPLRWPAHGAWKLPAAIVIADFCYYLYHRAGHRFALFWSIHGIHHQHEHLNSSVAFRLEWLADPYAAIFFGLMPLLGVDSTTGFAALALLSFYTLTAHSPVVPRRSWGFWITPAIHGSHHSRDARFSDKNYGAMLGIWDRLFGTWLELPPGEPLRADLPSICRTHNGVRAQWGLVVELWRALQEQPTLRAKVRLLAARPALADRSARLRDDREISRTTRIYVLVHFVALVPFAAWLLWFRDDRPLAVKLGGSLALLGGLYTLGALLDGQERAAERERWRLGATVVVGAAFALHAPVVGIGFIVLALGGLLASTTLLARAAGTSPNGAT